MRRIPRQSDRRCVVARITERGRERFLSASSARVQAEREVLGRLDDGDRERLMHILARLTGEE